MSFAASYPSIHTDHPDDPSSPREIGRMGLNTGRKRPTQAELRQETRARIADLVEGHEVRAGRMQAYAIVGRIVGRTGEWVRKLVAGRPVAVLAADYSAVAEAHLSFLDRQAARAVSQQRRAEAAMEEWNAIRPGDAGARAGLDGAPSSGSRPRRRPVAP